MNRPTLIMLVIFAGLAVVWLVGQRESARDGLPPLIVEGYVGDVTEADARDAMKNVTAPYVKFSLDRTGEHIELVRDPGAADAKDDDLTWSATRTADTTKIEAKGQNYRVRMWNQELARSFRASFSFEAKPEELAEYGLDDAHAVTFVATAEGASVKLRVGKVDKTNAEEPVTWLMNPDVPTVVYQVRGRDLRTPFDQQWKDIRDTKLLGLTMTRVNRIELTTPGDKRAPKVVVERQAATEAQLKELADGKKDKDVRKPDEGWVIVEPKGYATGDVGAWLEALERVSATAFVDADKIEDMKATGLEDPAIARRIVLHEGDQEKVLLIGAKDEKESGGEFWVRVEGQPQAARIASWSHDQVAITLDKLRDLALLGERRAKDTATAFHLVGPNVTLDGRKQAGPGAVWKVEGLATDSRKVSDWLGDLDTTKVEFVADKSRDEAGLASPEWRLQLQFPAGMVEVQLGKEDGGAVYGALGADGDLFKIQSWSVGRLKKAADDFRDKHIAAFASADATALWLDPRSDIQAAVHLAKDKEGKWSIVAPEPGAPLADGQPADLIDALVNVEYQDKVTDQTASTAGLEKDFHLVKVAFAGVGTFELRISGEKTSEGHVYAGRVERGRVTQIWTLRASSVTPLEKTLEDLKKK